MPQKIIVGHALTWYIPASKMPVSNELFYRMFFNDQSIILFQHPYCVKLMHAMSVMARKDGREGALHYFNQPDDHHVSMNIYSAKAKGCNCISQ